MGGNVRLHKNLGFLRIDSCSHHSVNWFGFEYSKFGKLLCFVLVCFDFDWGMKRGVGFKTKSEKTQIDFCSQARQQIKEKLKMIRNEASTTKNEEFVNEKSYEPNARGISL